MQLGAPTPAKQATQVAQPTPGAAQVAEQATTALAQRSFFLHEHPNGITVFVKSIAILVLLTSRRTGFACMGRFIFARFLILYNFDELNSCRIMALPCFYKGFGSLLLVSYNRKRLRTVGSPIS